MKKLFVIGPFYAVNVLRVGVKRTDRGLIAWIPTVFILKTSTIPLV